MGFTLLDSVLTNADVTFHAVPHRAGMTVGVEATTCGSISYAECTLEYQLPAYFKVIKVGVSPC